MRIKGKIYAMVAALTLPAMAIAGIAYYGMNQYEDHVQELRLTSQRAYYGEKLNRLVTAVVMESRGIYGAPNTEKAKPFAKNLMARLDDIDGLLKTWSAIVPQANKEAFEKVVDGTAEFRKFRTEVARLGTEDDPKLADAAGNNDANRQNRKEYQAVIDTLVNTNMAHLEEVQQATEATYTTILTEIGAIAAICILAGLAISFYIGTFSLSRPLSAVSRALTRLAGGDLDTEIPAKRAKDEIGDIWGVVGTFRDSLAEAERLRAEHAANAEQVAQERRQGMLSLADEFERAVSAVIANMSTASGKLVDASEALMSSAAATTDKSTAAAGASEQTYANVQSVANASEELSASFREIGTQIAHAAKLISTTAHKVDSSDSDVQELSQSAHRVEAIVGIIRDIAEQTNLLALNATIEAARAGEAGRGFAVVASEVKALASQTAKATQDIEVHIAAIQSATERTVGSIQEIGRQVRELNEVATVIAGATEEQATVSQEIARNVSEAATGTGEVSRNVVGVKEASGVTDTAAGEVFSFAQTIADQSTELRSQVDRLLNMVRAA